MKRIFTTARPVHILCTLLSATLLLTPLTAWSIDLERDDVRTFITELNATEGIDTAYISATLADSKVQQSILDAMSRPAEKVKPWHEYRAIFITPERINAGVKFLDEHGESLARIEADTGVPKEMILGIIGVESYYGRITGSHRVLDALATLGFDYPPRAKFFRSELAQAFLLANEEDLNLLEVKGSYAGAMGPPQFIPSSYRAYSVDGDGDGRRDLLGNWQDIMASVANYFVAHKWQAGQPVAELGTVSDAQGVTPNEKLKPQSTVGALTDAGVYFQTELSRDTTADVWRLEGADGDEYWVGFRNLYVITRYNRSIMYALAAWELGNSVVLEAAK